MTANTTYCSTGPYHEWVRVWVYEYGAWYWHWQCLHCAQVREGKARW